MSILYTVIPYPSYNTWTGSEVDVAEPRVALLCADESGAHLELLTEEPPPYTEVAQNGHVSLMHGRSPKKLLRDGSRNPRELSASFTAGARELEASTASALLPLNVQGEDDHLVQAGLPTSVRASTENSQLLAMEREALLQLPPDYSEYSDRSQLERASLQEYGSYDYQLAHHYHQRHSVGSSSSIFPPRSITRSRSLDAANLEGRTLNRMDSCPSNVFPRPLALLPTSTRAGTLPPPLAPFPPRPGTIPPLRDPLLPHHPHQPLPPVTIRLQNRLVRPPPLRSLTLPPSVGNSSSDNSSLSSSLPDSHLSLSSRLPPIQLQGEVRTQGGKQHRKRHKRKRGQTWHAETQRMPLVSEQNAVVAE